MRQLKRGWRTWGLTVLLAGAVALTGCGNDNNENGNEGAAGGDAGAAVAVYEGGTLTLGEFEAYEGVSRLFNPYYDQLLAMDPSFRESVVRQKVAIELLYAQADEAMKEQEAEIAETDFETLRENMIASVGNEEAWNQMLESLGVTEDDVKDYILKSNTVRAGFVAQTDEAGLQQRYDEMAAEHQFDTATVRHILVALKDSTTQEDLRTEEEALERANDIKQQLEGGADFADLAKEYSDDPGSKENGGLYENVDVNQWVEEFKQAAITLPLNTISDPVKTSYGYHVMRVEARQTRPFEEVRDSVESAIISEKFGDYIDNELPDLIEDITLPQDETAEASPSPSPAE